MVKAAAIQMVSSDCVSDNLLLAERLIKEASVAGAKLIALPENFAYLGNRDDLLKVREKANHGPIQDFLSEQARINHIKSKFISPLRLLNRGGKFHACNRLATLLISRLPLSCV